MSRYIQKLINQGEDQKLDFKFEISDSRKIARTLVAFSNTEGGKLLIGIKDNGVITGIRSDEEYYMVEAAAQLYCKPTIHFTCKRWEIKGKTILEIEIPKALKKPYYAQNNEGKWESYIRVMDQNLLANNVLLKVWQKQRSSRGIHLKYGDKEKILLDYLRVNKHITVSKYCRLGKISYHRAEEILANLIILGVIQMIPKEKKTYFILCPEESLKRSENQINTTQSNRWC